MISGVTNGFGFAFIYSLDRSVFVEDIKKQDTVHLHLITNDPSKVVKEIHESARRSKDSI